MSVLASLTYDREADALYLQFSEEEIEETIELAENVDVDKDGNPVGFEVLGVEPELLASLPIRPEVLELQALMKRSAA
ncbi:MAG: DUF2283 domain-containing protein [Thermomicrobiales bacterium]|nr:DUF2283 domain-containing protein [Thermomicrobiales bacterium]